MKKIISSLLALAVICTAFTACSEDRDSNPTFSMQDSTFVLNTPAAVNQTYDLANSEYVVLTTNQPDFGGFPLPTIYTVHVSLDGENFATLPTTHTSAYLQVPASEIAEAMQTLASDGTDLTQAQTIYIYLTANVSNNEDLGTATSNTITLPSVVAEAAGGQSEVTLPSTMYIVGSFPASDGWSTFVPLHAAYSQDGFFYGVVYVPAGAEFKINPDAGWKGNDKGYGQLTVDDQSGANVQSADASNDAANLKLDNAGWYNFCVKAKAVGENITYTLIVYDAKVYIIGAAEGGNWSAGADGTAFTAPSDASGEWVSPAFAGSGELRMYVDCGIDWWKTEFTINQADGSLYYRDVDIPNNWAESLGSDYSVNVSAGQKAYVNFTAETGRVE